MLICLDCGQTFDEEDVVVKKELMGEFWGADAYDEHYYCPHCGGDQFDEAHECRSCGKWFLQEHCEEECQDCMAELSNDLHELKNKYEMTFDDFQQFIADVFGW